MTEMTQLRALICALVAIAITFASVVSAWASIAHRAPVAPQVAMVTAHGSEMSDCDRTMRAAKADQPDDKKDESCADNFCMAKCFKLFSGLQSRAPAIGVFSRPQSSLLDHPVLWFDQPPLAPPRH